MKIGYLVQNLDRKTGVGRFAADIVDGAKTAGHEVTILKESEDGIEGHVVLRRGLWGMISSVSKSRKLLQNCDVIHAIDGYPYGIIASLANKKLQKRLIISALGTYAVAPLYRKSTSHLLKQAYRSAYEIVAISNFTKQEILKKVSLENIIVINPGIQVGHSSEERIKTDKRFVLGVGGFKERKGYHVSLAAFIKIAARFPDVRYVMLGDENIPYQAVLDKMVKKNGLEDRVEFLHKIPENRLQELYHSASLFILTPINVGDHHFEGFGLVYLEAALAGLPVIGTFGNGAEDAIEDGKNGILVPQNDIDKTAEAIASILSDPEKQRTMSRASFDWAKSHSIEKQVRELIEIYKQKIK